MLRSLKISNFLLIEESYLTFSKGLNIITGETGAGKSIILDAIELLLGKRFDANFIFNKKKKCIIEAVFDIGDYHIKSLIVDLDLDYDDTIILRREITPYGKNRIFFNDTPITLHHLKQIAKYIIDIHGQEANSFLYHKDSYRTFVDNYLQDQSIIKKYRAQFEKYKALINDYRALLKEAKTNNENHHNYKRTVQELQKIDLDSMDQRSLESELNIIDNNESIKTVLLEVNTILGEENGVDYRMNTIKKSLNSISDYKPLYQKWIERMQVLLVELEDINLEIEKEQESIMFNEQYAKRVRETIDRLYYLEKKYNCNSVAKLIELRDDSSSKLEDIINYETKLEVLKKDIEEFYDAIFKIAENISTLRKRESYTFSREIEEILCKLNMPFVKLFFSYKDTDLKSHGKDDIELLFTSNKGIEPQLLRQSASMGEVSRIMLSIKYLLAERINLPTMIFDEIEVGISGETAIQVANMFKKMAKKHQIIAITHLPQIAAKADAHYLVSKDQSTDTTITKIQKIESSKRVSTIAKMIGGDNPTQSTYQSAIELMENNIQ